MYSVASIKNSLRLNAVQFQYLLLVAAYVLGLIWLFPLETAEIHKAWVTPMDLELGYFVLAIAVALVVRNAAYVAESRPYYLGLIFFLLVMGLYLVGLLVDLRTFRHISIALGFPMFAISILGRGAWNATWVPTCMVLSVLPASYLALPHLQYLTVEVVTYFVRLTPMTAYIEGAYIHVPEGVIWVKEGCSGHKYFVAAGALALIVIAYDRRSLTRSLHVLATAILLSLIANWVRVFILVLVGYYSGLDHPLMADHDNLGWVVFGVMMLPFFYIASKQKSTLPPADVVSEHVAVAPVEDGVSDNGEEAEQIRKGDVVTELKSEAETNPEAEIETETESKPIDLTKEHNFKHWPFQAAVLCLALLILFMPRTVESLKYRDHGQGRSEIIFNDEMKAWRSTTVFQRDWYVDYPQPDREYYQRYRKLNRFIDATALIYYQQKQGEELDSTSNNIFDFERWRRVSKQAITLTDVYGKEIPAIRVVANKGAKKRLALYWHRVNGVSVRPGLKGKLLSLAKIWNHREDDMLMALSMECEPNCNVAEQVLVQFVNEQAYFSVRQQAVPD